MDDYDILYKSSIIINGIKWIKLMKNTSITKKQSNIYQYPNYVIRLITINLLIDRKSVV